MSRQDANSAFARTSFLYGGNAAYIEDLYAQYEADFMLAGKTSHEKYGIRTANQHR
jgi:2-oxoglutarate dehydrogenase complex dehydrogenase (E1) component-like enzyme